MLQELSFSQFAKQFPDNNSCFEEIKRVRYPKGIPCPVCKQITSHYRIKDRPAYACSICRHQTFPLAGTLFEKSTTSLRLWFYALFLMTHTRGDISALQLQRELGVTYKTAWRMRKRIRRLMSHNNGDLLRSASEDYENDSHVSKIRKWTFFKHFEIAVIEKNEQSESGT